MMTETAVKNTFNLEETLLELRLMYMRTVARIWKSNDTLQEHTISSKVDYIVKNIEHISVLNESKILKEIYATLKSNLANITLKKNNIQESLNIVNKVFNTFLLDIENYNTNNKSNSEDYKVLKALASGKVARIFIELCDTETLKKLWEICFGKSFFHPNFGVQMIKPTALWNYYGDNQWTKPDTEALYVGLPNLPEEKFDEYTKAEYLTAYYRQFPNFMGKCADKNASSTEKNESNNVTKFFKVKKIAVKNQPPIDSTLYLERRTFDIQERDPAGNNFNLGIANDQFLSFGSVLMRAISVLWNNKSLRYRMNYAERLFSETDLLDNLANDSKELELDNIFQFSYYLNNLEGEDAKKLKAFDSEYDMEVAAILKKYFHYESPWVFRLRFLVTEPNVFFEKESDNSWAFKETINDVINLTTIEIPFAPEVAAKLNNNTHYQEDNIALALARYNATGPAYPFTCS